MTYLFKRHNFAASESLGADGADTDVDGGFIASLAKVALHKRAKIGAKKEAPVIGNGAYEAHPLVDTQEFADVAPTRLPPPSLFSTASSIRSQRSLADLLASGCSGRNPFKWLPDQTFAILPHRKPQQLKAPSSAKTKSAEPNPGVEDIMAASPDGNRGINVVDANQEVSLAHALSTGLKSSSRQPSKDSVARSNASKHSKEGFAMVAITRSMKKPEYFGKVNKHLDISKGSSGIVVGHEPTYMKWDNCAALTTAFSFPRPPPFGSKRKMQKLNAENSDTPKSNMTRSELDLSPRMGSKLTADALTADTEPETITPRAKIAGGLESRCPPWSADQALALLRPEHRPSKADKLKMEGERPGAPHRELIAACLTGHQKIDQVMVLAQEAEKSDKDLKLTPWFDPGEDLEPQVVAAALATMNSTHNLSFDDSPLQSVGAIFLWINLRTLSLRNCKYLTEVSGLRKCTYLQSVDFSYSENLTSLRGLRELVDLRFTSFMGCNSLSGEELWNLAVHLGSVDGSLVWPNRRFLDKGLGAMKRSPITILVVKASQGGGQALLSQALASQHNTAGIDLRVLRKAITYAEEVGVDAKLAKDALYNASMEQLLSSEDRRVLRAATGRRHNQIARRAAAVCKWLGLCPRDGITSCDLRRFLEHVEFEPPREEPNHEAFLFRLLDVELRGALDKGLLIPRLDGGFKGPLDCLRMEGVAQALTATFGSVEAALSTRRSEIITPRPSKPVDFFRFQAIARQAGIVDSLVLAGAWVWLDVERKGTIGQTQFGRLHHLPLLTSVRHADMVIAFMLKTFGTADASWSKLDHDKVGQVNWHSMATLLSQKNESPKVPESSLQLLFNLLSEDGSGQISKKDWAKIASWEGADAILDDLRQLWKYCRKRFGSSSDSDLDYLSAGFQNFFPEGEDTGRDTILFEQFKDGLNHWEISPKTSLRTVFTVLNRTNRNSGTSVTSRDTQSGSKRGSAVGNLDNLGSLVCHDWMALILFEIEERRDDVTFLLDFLRAQAEAGSDSRWATTWDLVVEEKRRWKALGDKRPSRASQFRARMSASSCTLDQVHAVKRSSVTAEGQGKRASVSGEGRSGSKRSSLTGAEEDVNS